MLSTVNTKPVVTEVYKSFVCPDCRRAAKIVALDPDSYKDYIRAEFMCECGITFCRTFMPARYVDD
jgi:hypothetical protein